MIGRAVAAAAAARAVANPEATLPPIEPGMCTCPRLGVTDLDRLDDLLVAGFELHEASHMLWHWSRARVSRHLRSRAA